MDPQLPGRYNPRLSEVAINDANKQQWNSEETFRRVYQYESKSKPSLGKRMKKEMKCSKETLMNLFPITKWLPQYKKEDLVPDVMSGLTVAVMHIPQGMAYALLGSVPPVVGIYTALFPVFVYIVMGTSPHVSMGSFAVVSMMVGKSVTAHSDMDYNSTHGNVTEALTPIRVATTVCFAVGIWQTLLGILRLGSLSVFLSSSLISGFTTGAAVHVFSSQVKSLLGLRLKRYSGPFKVIFTYYEIILNLSQSNYVAVLLSGCTLILLGSYNEFVKPYLNTKFRRNIPLPVELIIVVIATVISKEFKLNEDHDIATVSHVPTGFPTPSVPPLEILPQVLIDSLIISVVAIAINLSMVNIFAKKVGNHVNNTQEILASGIGNSFGAFFSCMPFAVSLSRSLIQQSVGARTQIANVVSCIILGLVLLFIAPFFEPLPYCVLSAIIVVALKGMFLQFRDVVKITKLSKLDGCVWITTFLAVVIIDIDYGLGIGLLTSVGTMIFRSQQPTVSVMGRIPGTELYRDRKLYRKAQSPEGYLVLDVVGVLHFANAEIFRKALFKEILEFQTRSILLVHDANKPIPPVNLILSMSSVPYMDPSAVTCLKQICAEITKMNGKCLLCDFVPSVYDTLQHCHFFDDFPVTSVFPTVAVAVECIERFDPQFLSNKIIQTIA